MTKAVRLIHRPDGSEIKIVGTLMDGIGLHESIDVYALRRADAASNWELLSNTPAAGWKQMSRDEYIARGRSPMMQAVTIAEILSVTSALHN